MLISPNAETIFTDARLTSYPSRFGASALALRRSSSRRSQARPRQQPLPAMLCWTSRQGWCPSSCWNGGPHAAAGMPVCLQVVRMNYRDLGSRFTWPEGGESRGAQPHSTTSRSPRRALNNKAWTRPPPCIPLQCFGSMPGLSAPDATSSEPPDRRSSCAGAPWPPHRPPRQRPPRRCRAAHSGRPSSPRCRLHWPPNTCLRSDPLMCQHRQAGLRGAVA